MKKIATILFILTGTLTGFYIYKIKIESCKNPIFYDIGGFDNRFNISKDKFLTTVKEAEVVWENKTGLNLFEYKSASKFKINLIFDDRQESTIGAKSSKEEIEGSRTQYDRLLADYKILASSYDRDMITYNKNVATFESRLNSYNNHVGQINAKGGATPKEFEELEKEKLELENLKSNLDYQRTVLNGRASELNSLGDSVNSLAKKLNITVDIYNQRYGEAREFDQGEFSGDNINIYQFETIGDLRLVLAHEFGHALGIEHVENAESIMYYLMDQQNIQNPVLSREDLEALRSVCSL